MYRSELEGGACKWERRGGKQKPSRKRRENILGTYDKVVKWKEHVVFGHMDISSYCNLISGAMSDSIW